MTDPTDLNNRYQDGSNNTSNLAITSVIARKSKMGLKPPRVSCVTEIFAGDLLRLKETWGRRLLNSHCHLKKYVGTKMTVILAAKSLLGDIPEVNLSHLSYESKQASKQEDLPWLWMLADITWNPNLCPNKQFEIIGLLNSATIEIDVSFHVSFHKWYLCHGNLLY